MKGLWESEPENPAYFADYTNGPPFPSARAYATGLHGDGKQDRSGQRVVHRPMAAGGLSARESIGPEGEDHDLSEGRAEDQSDQGFRRDSQEALDLMRQAASRKRFDSYQTALAEGSGSRCCRNGRDWIDQMVPIAYTAGLSAPQGMKLKKSIEMPSRRKQIRLVEMDKDSGGFPSACSRTGAHFDGDLTRRANRRLGRRRWWRVVVMHGALEGVSRERPPTWDSRRKQA